LAVDFKIHGAPGSAEHDAALTLAEIFKREVSSSATGHVDFCPNLKIVGQKNKDIDLLVVGRLHDATLKVELEQDGRSVQRELVVESFAFVIEVKDHDVSRASLSGNRILVSYEGHLHDATQQASDEMYSLLNFLKPRLGDFSPPYMCNFVWMRNIPMETLRNLGQRHFMGGGNTLPTDFSLCFLFRIACGHQRTIDLGNRLIFSGFGRDGLAAKIDQKVVELVAADAPIPSELTRRRVERLNSRILAGDDELKKAMGSQLVVFAGRAGTGKTVRMLRAACELASEQNRRCLFLAFNRALVQDLRRLLFLAEIPDAPDHCVSVLTIHEFVRSVASALGLIEDGAHLLGQDDYSAKCAEITACVRGGAITPEDLQKLAIRSPETLSWDYVFVDEAQDCADFEKELLFALFDYRKISIADGVDQFLRGIRPCEWARNVYVTRRTEARSLRQKRNLASFANTYAEDAALRWSVDPVETMTGGNIILCRELYPFEVFKQVRNDALTAGNDAYDIMFLVPPALVQGPKGFGDIQKFEQQGFLTWDGTNKDLLRLGPADTSQHRLLQYASCRGLEAWTVVCIGFDEYIRHTAKFLPEETDALEPQLASPQERLARAAGLRLLIPLTRAIDTLVITCCDWHSPEALGLRQLGSRIPDIVTIRD
jgi:hypothetical protein